MTVSGISGTRPVGPVAPAQHAQQAGFVVPGVATPAAAGLDRAEGSGPAARVSSVALLALQEGATAEAGSGAADREARQHGRALLAALAELQRALLSGGDGHALEQLLALVDQEPRAVDPALARLIGAIRLRARIELARAAASGSGSPGPAS
ncbi:flagellar assembly protein FliX [Lichenicola sp.]|uniref:flagellar assembly protein FliX n=1 Tax=Lichenicola sp. TaxID=2804529 RepID=UPI003AFFAA04